MLLNLKVKNTKFLFAHLIGYYGNTVLRFACEKYKPWSGLQGQEGIIENVKLFAICLNKTSEEIVQTTFITLRLLFTRSTLISYTG